MADKNSDQSIMDKSMRSVFVGNIPYEATEEKLKEIFSEVGPVVSLKLVFDRESGKPKGFGFCEYKDQETALSAMRNLNGYEIGGRTLRVDNACTEKSRMEMQQLLQGPQVENPYGDHCEAEQAPEIITKTVASLPPEQMFELMKQMKLCIQNNPSEARQMLMLNPQLAYALLQAMVVMRIVDPPTALGMLFKVNQMPPVLGAKPMISSSTGGSQVTSSLQQSPNMPSSAINAAVSGPNFNSMQGSDVDLRPMASINIGPQPTIDHRMSRNIDQDLRVIPNPVPPPLVDIRNQRQQQSSVTTSPTFPTDPRQRPIDPRLRSSGSLGSTQVAQQTTQQQLQNRLASNCGLPNDASDQEKAALIMQVLQLTDEQISQLPPEQRTSILVLKEQIAKSTQR
ncbi:cleavage stimulation factor subunit 2 [Stomoxys calcitrans]|uniref:RRM domain-containing protein n=1 Tax=Stomoxys calcitrans TaxID=35570 RepID=A0A1I8PAL0_STOCA|nr:cleavage stimulation factor subunit 2 [Stomoxys calcitrans]